MAGEGSGPDLYKLIHYYETDEWECFDLEQDPGEMENVYPNPEYAAVVEGLREELVRLRAYYRDETGSEPVPAEVQG